MVINQDKWSATEFFETFRDDWGILFRN